MICMKEQKFEALLDAASEMMKQYGPRKITLEDVAKKVGLTKTAIYYYFKNKDELLLSCIERDAQELLRREIEATESAQGIERKLIAFGKTRHLYLMEKTSHITPELFEDIKKLILNSKIDFTGVRVKLFDAERQIVKEILEDGINSGEINPVDDLDTFSAFLIASAVSIEHIFIFNQMNDSPISNLAEKIETFTSIFYNGLKEGPTK